jgi:PAS domain S-box-containing protein
MYSAPFYLHVGGSVSRKMGTNRWSLDEFRDAIANGGRHVEAKREGSAESSSQPKKQHSSLYETMVENANEQILIVQDEEVKFANKKVCDVLGYSKQGLEKKKLTEIIAPSDREAAIKRFKARMSGESKQDIFEQILLTKDGKEIQVEVNASVIEYRGGKADLAYSRDISQEKRMMQEIVQSEKKYGELFENVKDVVYISNKEGKLIDINSYGLELFGYAKKEDILRIDLSRELYANPHRRKQFQEAISKSGYVKDFEAKFKKRNGAEIVALITSTAIRDKEGEITGYQGIIRDITELRKREKDKKRRSRELAILNHIYSIVHRSLILQEVLADALREMIKLIRAQRGWIFLLEEDGQFRMYAASRREEGLSKNNQTVKFDGDKLPSSPTFLQGNWTGNTIGEKMLSEAMRSRVLWVPLKAARKDLGIILLRLKDAGIPDEELRLVRLSANQIAGAIERAKLYSDIMEKEQKLKVLSNSLINMQEEERRRISRELHDEISQALTAVEIELKVLRNRVGESFAEIESFEKIGQLVRNTSTNIRRISLDLRPVLLDELGLGSAVRWYVNEFIQRTGIHVSVQMKGMTKRLDQQREIMIFRIIQECLTNVFKHAEASKASVELFDAGDSIRLSVGDDGRGFQKGKGGSKINGHGLGLFGIQERLKIIGGVLEVESGANGTRVFARIPM